MLPLHILLKQLTTLQSLTVERLLQESVSFDSKALLVFNSMMLGQNAEEIKAECHLTDDNYPKYERPIYNCILEIYGVKANTVKDNLLIETYYAVNETVYNNEDEKAKNLERIFHQLKKNQIEQESVDLLLALHKLHLGTPLQAVYSHLYDKYKKIKQANNTAIEIFVGLNKKLTSYLKNRSNDDIARKMILDYKSIRQLNGEAENRSLSTILNVSRLLLASIGNQKQLLKDDNIDEVVLLSNCKNDVDNLPFGVERYFMQNIIMQIEMLQNTEELVSRKEKETKSIKSAHVRFTEPYNFSFPNEVYQQIDKDYKIAAELAAYRNNKKKRSLPKLPFTSSVGRNINSFSFSGDSWSIPST